MFCLRIVSAMPLDFRKLEIVTNLSNAGYAQSGHCIAEGNDEIQFSLMLAARVGDLFSEIFISPVDGLILSGDTIPAERLKPWDFFETRPPLIRWYLILPAKPDTVYRNSSLSVSPWAQIIYREIPLPEWDDQWTVEMDDLAAFDNLFPGTVRLKAEIAFYGQFIATPGIENRFQVLSGDYGGLSEDVFRLSVKGRTGNRFLDNLLIFRNLPYIANSNSWNGYWSDHQAKCWIGGDLLNFTFFAAELAGQPLLKYYNKLPLPPDNTYDLTDYYKQEVYYNNGLYRTEKDEPVWLDSRYFGLGDFIISRYRPTTWFLAGRLAVLAADMNPGAENPNRQLDGADLVLMNRRGALELLPLKDALGDTLTLIRWQKRW